MDTFVARYRSAITATLSGFDRLVFRGTLRGLVMKGGMQAFLNSAGVRMLDFKQYVLATSERVKEASLRGAIAQQRPIRYPESARIDKEELARQLLRVETTIGNPAEFQVLRARERARRRTLAWQPMRKGLADLHRRAAVSQRANERYLDALAAVEDSTPVHQIFDQVARRARWRGPSHQPHAHRRRASRDGLEPGRARPERHQPARAALSDRRRAVPPHDAAPKGTQLSAPRRFA